MTMTFLQAAGASRQLGCKRDSYPGVAMEFGA
jgi:hypothetical protein